MKIKDTILSKLETVKYKMELKEFKTRSKRFIKNTYRRRESRNAIIWVWEDMNGELGKRKSYIAWILIRDDNIWYGNKGIVIHEN